MKLRSHMLTAAFLLIELTLYILLLSFGGTIRVCCEFASIVLCFLFALIHRSNALVVCGLACTVMADFFLVVCTPTRQLWGMVCFLGTQTFYAVMLQRSGKNKLLLFIRLVLIAAAEITAALVLKDRLDVLVVVSMCYYASLVANIIESFARFFRHKLFAVALVLFLLCDTVIGLQSAAVAYLPIPESSLIHRIIFMDFHLSWFFYLPSQVLIALKKEG